MNDVPSGKIVGVGRALGGKVVTNHDLEKTLDTSDEWISHRTGIKERRFVSESEDCATLAVDAALAALDHAGVRGDSIDLIICATSTGPESMPSVACLVGEAIGAPGIGGDGSFGGLLGIRIRCIGGRFDAPDHRRGAGAPDRRRRDDDHSR